MALFFHHTPFSFAKTMIISDIVFFFIAGLRYLYEANQTSAFIEKKKKFNCRLAQDPSEALAREEPTVTT